MPLYLLQICFNLADEGVEDSVYDSYAMKEFVGIDVDREDVPDATTLLRFRHLWEGKRLQKAVFDKTDERLEAEGVLMRGRSIVDETVSGHVSKWI